MRATNARVTTAYVFAGGINGPAARGMASILLHVLTTARGRAQFLTADGALLAPAANSQLKVAMCPREAKYGPT